MKYVLITGGNSGIGLELAKKFAADGFGILLAASDEKKLLTAKCGIEKAYSVPVITYLFDLARQGEAKKLYEAVKTDRIVVGGRQAFAGR